MLTPISELSILPSWGNAKDVQTLAKSMVRAVYQIYSETGPVLDIPSDVAQQCVQRMLADRRARN